MSSFYRNKASFILLHKGNILTISIKTIGTEEVEYSRAIENRKGFIPNFDKEYGKRWDTVIDINGTSHVIKGRTEKFFIKKPFKTKYKDLEITLGW